MNIKSYIIYLLNKKAYTEHELNIKLIKKGFLIKDIENIIKKCKKSNLINDNYYMENFIKNQIKNKYKSFKEIEIKLKKKGLKYENLLKKLYTEKEEKFVINNLINRCLKRKKLTKEKIIKYLLNKGFSIENILENINRIDI